MIELKSLYLILSVLFAVLALIAQSQGNNGLNAKLEPSTQSVPLQLPTGFVNPPVSEPKTSASPRQTARKAVDKLPPFVAICTLPIEAAGRQIYTAKDTVTGKVFLYFYDDNWERQIIETNQ